ncbi:DUF3267 domain-containing protein [Thermococcus sp.]|uniref:DUF3267 domain-containing protein n=1 Tax=Thermococcus sp. TaxID=35749 RepID=UPI00261F48D2|nr:DUF3267 domain-containing protein [Thermococcus sp.]
MGELRLSDYSSDVLILSFLLLFLSPLAVPWFEVSISSPGDALYLLFLPWFLVVPLHEGLHVLAARLLGARVRFGLTTINRLVLVPYVAIETPLPARKYIIVSLSPLILSLAALTLAWLLHSNFWALVYVFNTAGMAGDFLTALSLLRIPSDAEVFDDGTTLRSGSEVPLPYPSWVSSVLKAAVILVFLALILFGRIEVVVESG